jgi:CrcB protein
MELKLIALAGAGGFIGSSLRYAVSYLVMLKFGEVFPLGTLAVNIVGSFLLGMLLGLALVKPEQGVATLSMPWKVFLSTGICGGFTTFSAFSAETLRMTIY